MPQALHPYPAGAPTNRLGLAQWLVDPSNPLTARVAVNRFWAQLFGTGLVETEEDFGTQGEPPSHPELLDWLAVQLPGVGLEHQGAVADDRHLGDLPAVVESHARASGQGPAQSLAGAGPRVRLEAEMVRDQALALSGLLSRKVGGPSVFPPQPGGLWQAAFNGERTWTTSQGEDRYRRGLYTFWRRTVPYPSMATFDAPSREICAIRRIRTNTPLQSFVTLNDPVYVEAAQALARRIVREGGSSLEARARYALQLCLGRPPRPEQLEPLVNLYTAEHERYPQEPQAAVALATEPIGPLPPGMEPADLAAWTTVANVLLNLDGVVDQRLIHMDLDLPLYLQQARAQTRRQFLKSSQTGLGAFALAMLLDREGAGQRRRGARGPEPESALLRRQPDGAAAAALRSQGQERHLSAHVRRTAPAGPVRLQAGAGQASHAALSRRAAQEPQVRVHQRAPQAAGHAVQVREMRAERRGRQRALAALQGHMSTTSRSSSRCTPTSSTMRRRSSSSTRAHLATAGPRWARGSPTAWARRTRTCPVSSS